MENKGPVPVTSPPPDLPECEWTAVNGTMNPHKCPLTTHARPLALLMWMNAEARRNNNNKGSVKPRPIFIPSFWTPRSTIRPRLLANSRVHRELKKLIFSQSHTSTHFPPGTGVDCGRRVIGGEGGPGTASMRADESSSPSMTIATHSKSMQSRVTKERESASQWRLQSLLMQGRTLSSTLHKCCVLSTPLQTEMLGDWLRTRLSKAGGLENIGYFFMFWLPSLELIPWTVILVPDDSLLTLRKTPNKFLHVAWLNKLRNEHYFQAYTL